MVARADPPRIRLTTGDMAYGPHAVARHDGKVVFVRGAAPDEEIEAVIRDERRTFAFADAVAIVRPSPQRRVPPCPYLPACGGCSWQHLTYDAQLAAKRRIVSEHLRRIAGLTVDVAPVLPSPNEFGYRRRIKLRIDGGAVGFYAGASHTLVPVDHCLLAEAGVDAAIGAARALVRALVVPLRRVELLRCDAGGDAVVVVGEVEGGWIDSADRQCRDWLADHPTVRGLALRGRGWRRQWGDVRIGFAPRADLPLIAHAPVFTQVNPEVNRLLVDTVVRWVDPRPGQQVLDLYAGAGNLSLALQRRGATVTAVEQDPLAAADAVENGTRFGGPPLRVIRDRAERALERLAAAGARFDAVVLDPPRSGAAACLPALLSMAPPCIVYVACDPATLARDLARLCVRYRVDAVQPLDMFPHSYHVETMVRVSLSCESETPGVSSRRRRESDRPSRRRRTQGRTS
jgi:23S rRNA (uracil1939-C5)-methyltransferase